MLYYTGKVALAINLDSGAINAWSTSRHIIETATLVESDESYLKDYGIEVGYINIYGDKVNVANAVRVYLDILIQKDFDVLEDFYQYYIDDIDILHDIFRVSYSTVKLNDENYEAIDLFLSREFGSWWKSYKQHKDRLL